MADTIKIKRSDTTATPSSLAAGELAYSESSGNLFYGRISDGAPVKIGGKTDVDKLALIEDNATADQTGSEIEGLLDTELGNTDWKKAVGTGAGTVAAGDHTHTHTAISDFDTEVDARIALADINDLADVNAGAPGDGQVLTWVNGSGEWQAQAAPSGVTNFVSLNDTPANFTSSGGFFVKVNSAANALEFVEAIDGGTF
jgi:hypothetical protein